MFDHKGMEMSKREKIQQKEVWSKPLETRKSIPGAGHSARHVCVNTTLIHPDKIQGRKRKKKKFLINEIKTFGRGWFKKKICIFYFLPLKGGGMGLFENTSTTQPPLTRPTNRTPYTCKYNRETKTVQQRETPRVVSTLRNAIRGKISNYKETAIYRRRGMVK